MKYFIFLFLTMLIGNVSIAQILQKNPETTHFDKINQLGSFSWVPARYESADFKYNIFYYIPKVVLLNPHPATLIFLHGGGNSTLTRAGSMASVHSYLPVLKDIADKLGVVIIAPSSNGLNWGSHTRGLIRELVTLVRTELNVDPNKIGVAGHSMGGMGITRNFNWTSDEVAFYLPISSGMNINLQSEFHLNKAFNVSYTQLLGKYDDFVKFIDWGSEQLKRTKSLELKYKKNSMFKFIVFNGGHNLDPFQFSSQLRNFLKINRNLYQKELWGSFHTLKEKLTENNISYDYDSEARYFWMELTDIDLSNSEITNFYSKIEGQKILIFMPLVPRFSHGLKIYLHSSMINLNQEIKIIFNGIEVMRRDPKIGNLRNMDSKDPGFNFEDVIEIKF